MAQNVDMTPKTRTVIMCPYLFLCKKVLVYEKPKLPFVLRRSQRFVLYCFTKKEEVFFYICCFMC